MRLADQILQSINTHQWEGVPTGPTGPNLQSPALTDAAHTLRGPLSWRMQGARKGSGVQADG